MKLIAFLGASLLIAQSWFGNGFNGVSLLGAILLATSATIIAIRELTKED